MIYKYNSDGTTTPVAGYQTAYDWMGTHAAYDIAVAQGKIKEGMVIFFTDDTAEADTYSLEEVKTNKTWIDGKPIYRKCFTGTGVTIAQSAASTAIPWAVLPNVDTFTLLVGMGDYTPSSGVTYKRIYNFTFGGYQNNADNILCVSGDSAFTFYVEKLVVEYTKTTD